MAVFNPKLITLPPQVQPAPILEAPVMEPMPQLEVPPIMPAPVAPLPPPQLVPIPVPVITPKPKGLTISPEVSRKAQGIYPQEQQAKQNMMDNAKMPTPTGAWGAPK